MFLGDHNVYFGIRHPMTNMVIATETNVPVIVTLKHAAKCFAVWEILPWEYMKTK